MGKIFKSQDLLVIESYYDALPANVSIAKIKYRKPDKTNGEFPATIDTEKKCFRYELKQGEPLGTEGKWTFWNFVETEEGRQIPGESWSIIVYEEGLDNKLYT